MSNRRARAQQAAADLERQWWEWENWHFRTFGWVPPRPVKEEGWFSGKQATWLDVLVASL